MKIGQEVYGVKVFATGRNEVVLEVGENPKVVAGSDGGLVEVKT